MASKYDHISFKPPAGVRSAAKRGLEFRKKAAPSRKGGLDVKQASAAGIGSGVQRASDLVNADEISPAVVRRMNAFFTRHEKNKAIDPKYKGSPWNDKGYVAWLLWGGDAGQAWAAKVVRQMDAADEADHLK